ncbi:MAG: O-acetyl-ADP-ribose deacetylase [Candidatus Bathyarchaeia archaeon]
MIAAEFNVRNAKIRLVQGDITDLDADAIVNAANPTLMGGGGVDGAIHRKGGPTILEECKRITASKWPNGLPTGKSVITSGGDLRAKHVIHTVGPIWHGGSHSEPGLLADAYKNSLKLAASKKLKTLALPSISTGAYGYPAEKASRTALTTVKQFLERESTLREITFVLFTEHDFKVYNEAANEIL